MCCTNQFLIEVKLERDKINSFSEYPFNLQAVKNLTSLKLHPNVTFIIGENGMGKSTLLEAIAVELGFNPEGGGINFNFATRNSHSELHNYLILSKGFRRPKDGYFLRAESFFNVATQIENLDDYPGGKKIIASYGGLSLHEQSHGESFMALLFHRFTKDSLYILDEPEAALSPAKQLSILTRIHQLVDQGTQFIIATHSPIIMSYPNADIYVLDSTGIKKVEYTQTEHYLITKDFLTRHEQMLEILMN